jgi:hypothetical protein
VITRSSLTAIFSLFLAMVWLVPTSTRAQDGGLAEIQKQLSSLYPTAKATADGTDLVTAGAVLVLQKDNLQMCKVDRPISTANFYKNGTINQGGLGGFLKAINTLNKIGNPNGAGTTPDNREFVAGEKFFVTRITTGPDGVVFALMSDPIKDQRYKSTLKFPFAKGTIPSPDDVTAMVAEVIKIDGPADAPAEQTADQSGGSAAPPPAAPTKTIAIGQTRDQVIATFGVPTKVVQLGSKEIDFFGDMKVTFVMSKVTNVE